MPNPRLASRYAKSLFDSAKEQNKVEAVLSDTQLIINTCANSAELLAVLESPLFSAEKKNEIIKAIFGDKIDSLTISFIGLLGEKGRESLLPEAAAAYVAQYQSENGILNAVVTTAVPLEAAQLAAFQTKIAAQFGAKDVILDTKVDPEIIGGFIIEIGDRQIDASVKRDLNDIKKQFLDADFLAKN